MISTKYPCDLPKPPSYPHQAFSAAPPKVHMLRTLILASPRTLSLSLSLSIFYDMLCDDTFLNNCQLLMQMAILGPESSLFANREHSGKQYLRCKLG